LGDAFVKLSQSEGIARTIGITSELELMAERRIYLKQVLETVDVVISPSRFLLQKVEDYGFKPRRVVYLPFGLEEALLSALPPRISAGKLRIGYLGQFAPHKGVHLLLAAFRKLATRPGTCELILHGITSDNSPYLRELLRLAKTDAAITFAGPYPNSEVGRVLSTLDVIAVPSVWYENRPSVIIEALANGTPVVAARLGGMAELIEHERNGLLFRAGSVEDLAQQLRRLVEDPLLLPKLRAGISPVKNLAQEIGELEEIYQGVAMTADIKSRISPR
jgi:glycosyltransferase involved in cell wall biosynthesis